MLYTVGDTVLFAVWPDTQLTIYPQISHADFAGEPVLLCSIAGRCAFPDTEDAFSERRSAVLEPPGGWAGTNLIAVADALAEWVLRVEGDAARVERLVQLAQQRDQASFDAWVAEAIAVGTFRRDDCALLVIKL